MRAMLEGVLGLDGCVVDVLESVEDSPCQIFDLFVSELFVFPLSFRKNSEQFNDILVKYNCFANQIFSWKPNFVCLRYF